MSQANRGVPIAGKPRYRVTEHHNPVAAAEQREAANQVGEIPT
ncbi:hypothetical protein C4K18_0150 [Pseudomonas chlororaphis subsp. aurantiaca]|nr:hypothetical protein C4K18_0150 [Pseudomonas chlororaphis subsp. aurantiaca]